MSLRHFDFSAQTSNTTGHKCHARVKYLALSRCLGNMLPIEYEAIKLVS